MCDEASMVLGSGGIQDDSYSWDVEPLFSSGVQIKPLTPNRLGKQAVFRDELVVRTVLDEIRNVFNAANAIDQKRSRQNGRGGVIEAADPHFPGKRLPPRITDFDIRAPSFDSLRGSPILSPVLYHFSYCRHKKQMRFSKFGTAIEARRSDMYACRFRDGYAENAAAALAAHHMGIEMSALLKASGNSPGLADGWS